MQNARAAKVPRAERDGVASKDLGDQNEFRDDELNNEPAPEFMQGSSTGRVATPEPAPSLSRSGRQRRAPRALQDFLPSSTRGLPAHIPRPLINRPTRSHTISCEEVPDESQPSVENVRTYDTTPNEFGVFHRYSSPPSNPPTDTTSLDDFCDSPSLKKAKGKEKARHWYHLFDNANTARIVMWSTTGPHNKSLAEIDRLVNEVIRADDFDPSVLMSQWRTTTQLPRLDSADDESLFSHPEGWRQCSVKIPIPKEKTKTFEDDAPTFEVGDIHM
ncbi:uncharacterized protein LAESUDRAFT_761398 [Laetiporus sulphureus 93-53]|uniref:Uncharacterized protein n=1 Tax=Laetiporus sulphureus 93-53 TaxID=1314785 RepID=A0A165D2U5_9APHY|nr:uncharacterized protein LAESUDRAFT_761398 [Laetiporus sulphureus 93-53]KZT04049.1 hypothetical protein LAESUDRAFT_761398 [Laetiporus sulphureus 93-53]